MASIIKSTKFRGGRKDAKEHIHKLDKSPVGSGWFWVLNVIQLSFAHWQHSSSGQIREDLFEEMRDGVLLCHLLEVLTGDYLPITTTAAAGTGNGNAGNGFDGDWGD